MRLIVGITGASGVIYDIRLICGLSRNSRLVIDFIATNLLLKN